MKTFEDFTEEGGFLEEHANVLREIESERLQKSPPLGINLDSDKFWNDLDDLDKMQDVEDEMSIAVKIWNSELYYGPEITHPDHPDVGERSVTKAYTEVIKKQYADYPNTKIRYSERNKIIRDALLEKVIEVHWEEWKGIYRKWLKYIHDNRGKLPSKKFGV